MSDDFEGVTGRRVTSQVEFTGLTGHVAFDTDGLRRSFKLDIVQLQEPKLVSHVPHITTDISLNW